MTYIVYKNLVDSKRTHSDLTFSAVSDVLGGYQPGFELVRGKRSNAVEHFVVVYIRGTPRLLLPAASLAMETAITSFLGNHRFSACLPRFLKAASWASERCSYISTDVSLISESGASSAVRALMSDVLQRDDFDIALRLSFGRPNAKTVALAISHAGEALCFAKFGSEAMTNELVAHEGAVLEQLEGSDIPLIMPRRLYSGEWADGHNALITAAFKLEPLKRDATSAHRAADALASHNLIANSALIESEYWQRIVDSVEELNDHDDSVEGLPATIANMGRVWGRCNFDFGASHGDWTRANLGIVNGNVAVLDWERYTQLAPRGMDIAHFAIAENSSRPFCRTLDLERVVESLRQYLKAADLPAENAEALIMFALLEMVIRFKSAEDVGLRSADSKFGSALQSGLQKWAI